VDTIGIFSHHSLTSNFSLSETRETEAGSFIS